MITETRIKGIFRGAVQQRWAGKAASAIAKEATSSPVLLTRTGFTGDAQADLRVHGGLEKAVHHYPADHYVHWAEQYGEHSMFRPGGFGENISTLGLTEQSVCIGDVFELGSSTIEISQGRQPCWKLNAHTGIEQLANQFQQTLKTGWYYRVLKEGDVQTGQTIRLLDRPNPEWTVARVTGARLHPRTARDLAEQLSQLQGLAAGWRNAFEQKRSADFSENTSRRLDG